MTLNTSSRRRLPLAPKPMSVREALSIVGSLGHPSKMPGFSFGISAFKCQRGSELRNIPGSVCGSCYARKDFYATYRPLLIGHARRWEGLEHPRWVEAMTLLVSKRCTPPQDYFRWHDSGDLQSVEHLARIVAVCASTPEVKHWLPTREYAYVDGFLAAGGRVPPNLCIRLSGEMIDAEPVIPYERLAGFPTSTVQSATGTVLGIKVVDGKGSVECKAVEKRDNKCGECRACWSPQVSNVSYPEH